MLRDAHANLNLQCQVFQRFFPTYEIDKTERISTELYKKQLCWMKDTKWQHCLRPAFSHESERKKVVSLPSEEKQF